MSFEVILVGGEGASARLPRKSDLLARFAGYVIKDSPPISRSVLAGLPGFTPGPRDDDLSPFTTLVVGSPGDGSCEISYSWGPDPDPPQSYMSVSRPLAASWLWAGIYRLMVDFDLYMVFPRDPSDPIAVRAHPTVVLPAGVQKSMRIVTVESPSALQEAVAGVAGDAGDA